MSEVMQSFENICDKEILQTNLSYMAIYIGLYEFMIDMVEDRITSFLCTDFERDDEGNLRYKHSDIYREEIKNRRVDDKGNKNTLKASMLWLVDEGAITEEDYNSFLMLKKLRDSYVHKMSYHTWEGLQESDAENLIKLLELYCKILSIRFLKSLPCMIAHLMDIGGTSGIGC